MIRLNLQTEKQTPKQKYQIRAHAIQSHQFFENFITICIILSTFCLALRYYKMSETYEKNLILISQIMDVIYNIEAIIKYFALRKEYFMNNWNIFDFSIVVVVDLAIIIEQSSQLTTDMHL